MMRNSLRAAAIMLVTFIMFLTSLPAYALSVEPLIISGEFRYYSSQLNEVRTHTFYYCDDYFSGSGKDINEHLRTMSLDLALTAFGTVECQRNVEHIFKETGFDMNDLSAQQMTSEPTEDSLGTVISHKNTAYGEVVAAVVRGIDYRLEWQNNVDVGASGPAAGFTRAAVTLADRIKEYEDRYSLRGAKIWIVGYSRGGAVVDLAGKYINEHLSDYGITDDGLYAYTFEAPAGCNVKTGYKNIHNVLNTSDVLTMTFPSRWGFCHAGTTEPVVGDDLKLRRMKLNYIGNVGIEETGEYSSAASIAKDFIDLLAKSVSRKKFAANSGYFGDLIRAIMSMSSDELPVFADYIKRVFTAVPDSFSVFSMVKLMSEDEGSSGYQKDVDRLCSAIGTELDRHDHGGIFSDEEYVKIREAILKTTRLLLPAVKADFSLDAPLERICSFFFNISEIAKQHFSDTVLYPTEALDSYHKPVTISGASITIDEKTAEVTSVRVGSRELAPGLDYTLRYMDSDGKYVDPVRTGVYVAVVSGTGSYTGTAEKAFIVRFDHHHSWKITSNGDVVSVMCTEPGCEDYGTGMTYIVRLSAESKEYDGSPAKADVVKSNGFPHEITIGDIVYDESGTYTDLSAIGKYRAGVRVYETESPDNGASACCDYSITRIYPAFDKLTIYTAADVSSDTEVFYNGIKLEALKDYTVSFTDKSGNEIAAPTGPGEYKIVWNGRGVYAGKVTRQFTLRQNSGPEPDVLPIIIAAVIAFAVVAVTGVTVPVITFKRRKNDI